MKPQSFSMGLIVVALVLAVVPGCKRNLANPVDPDKAREVLRTTLSAWQKGESADALQQRASITADDPRWKSGYRLIRYEVDNKDQVVGLDLHCRVRLVLQNADGQQSEEQAVYCVGTSAALVVVRAYG